jgi:tetratricopeptide (TPR) repeat protein
MGDRAYELMFLAQAAKALEFLGGWDEALGNMEVVYQAEEPPMIAISRSLPSLVRMLVSRGLLEEAAQRVEGRREAERSPGVLERVDYQTARSILLRAEGEPRGALEAAENALTSIDVTGLQQENTREAWVEAIESAFDLADLDKVRSLLGIVENLPPATTPVYLRGHFERFHARMAAAEGAQDRVDPAFKAAAGMFRELETPFWLAVTLIEHGEWLARQRRSAEAEPLLAEAREIFERLGSTPWLERVASVTSERVVSGR